MHLTCDGHLLVLQNDPFSCNEQNKPGRLGKPLPLQPSTSTRKTSRSGTGEFSAAHPVHRLRWACAGLVWMPACACWL